MFTENQVKGNWGEQYVAEQLADSGCLVRHVPQGHDSGIDLYCESLTSSGHPFLHFWCQVKTGQFDPNKPTQSFDIKSKDLDYWRRQPIPVFLVLVPDRSYYDEKCLYICSIARGLMERKRVPGQKQWRIKSRYKAPPYSIRGFLEGDLPVETVLWNLQHGKLGWLPQYPERQRLKTFPTGIVDKYETELKATLHYTLWRLAEDILVRDFDFETLRPKTTRAEANSAILRARPYIRALEEIVRGKRIASYQNFVTFGILAELDSNLKDKKQLRKAEFCYEKALSLMRKNGFTGQRNYAKYQKYLARVREKIVSLAG